MRYFHRFKRVRSTDSAATFQPLVGLALPIIVVNLGQQLMSMVDTALAGRIDAIALAATGLGSTLFVLGAIFGIGVVMGVDPIAAQSFGAEKPRKARRSMWQGLYAALIVTLPITGIIFAIGQNLELIGITSQLSDNTRLYCNVRLISLFPFLAIVAQRSYLQAAHLTRSIVIATVVANLFNFVADWVLIFGDEGLVGLGLPALGIPAFGVEGIAWASVVATVVQLIVMGWAIARIDAGPGEQSLWAADRVMLTQVLWLGIPIGFQLLSELGVFALVAMLAGRMGTGPMASHQVALTLAALTFMVPLAIGAATSVQVGRAIGRRAQGEPRRVGFAGIGLGGGFMFVTALVMWVFPNTLARIMTNQEEVIALAAELIRIAGTFQIFDGIQAVASGALRGAALTRWAMVANVVSYWLVALPVALLLGFYLGWGPHGLWWGLTVGLAVAAIVLTLKFNSASGQPIKELDLS